VEGGFSELRLEGSVKLRAYAARISKKRYICVMRPPLLSVMLSC
jgi:hypothetical protein